MKIILSIKPEFSQKILSGEKLFEFRKRIFSRQDIDTAIIYATKPVGKVVGEFHIQKVISAEPDKLWEITKLESGITRDYYFEYFKNSKLAFALCVDNPVTYDVPMDLKSMYPTIKQPPQSFIYVE